MVLLLNVLLAYMAPPFAFSVFFLVTLLFINLQFSITLSEMALLNMMAPPKLDFPFINVMLFKIIWSEAFILNILALFKPLIVKPLPLIVMAFVMVIPSLEKLLS